MSDQSINDFAFALPAKKRAFDLALCLLTFPAWLPLLILATLLLYAMEGRPIFYVSRRRVCGARSIRLWKFRTMVRNAAELVEQNRARTTNGARFLNVLPDSPLYTKVGRIYERIQFTELPQIMHVLRGEMSLVGARPLPESVVAALREVYPYAEKRFLVPCGLTGPVQLVGRDFITDEQRLRLEIAYCRACCNKYSVRLDLLVFWRTAMMVLGLRQPLTVDEAFGLIQRYQSSDAVLHVDSLEDQMAQEG